MKYLKRLTIPDKNSKYYNTISVGGASTCIKGRPEYPGLNVLSNCVGYVCGRFNEINGSMKYQFNMNAKNFINYASSFNLSVGTEPKLGSILCLNGTYGHVAVVEEVHDDHILTSESSYDGVAFELVKRYSKDGYTRDGNASNFQGFIYQPIEYVEEEQEEMEKEKFILNCNTRFYIRSEPNESSIIISNTIDQDLFVYDIVSGDESSSYNWFKVCDGYIAIIPDYQVITAVERDETNDYNQGVNDTCNSLIEHINKIMK